ncbi:MAG: hypothetical protein ACYCPS_04560 [Candidatus Saccharimonadales bacterium]
MTQSPNVQQFRVEHQAGIDLRVFDPAFRHAFTIEDGKRDKTDALFYDILTSPAGQRMLGINQLSKSETEETYEGSHMFKRWQHIAGVYRLVRYFGAQGGYSEEETAQFAVVACLPDLAHGVKSHVTDMLNEGMGGSERFHDTRAGQLLDLGGINEIFARHNFKSPIDAKGQYKIKVPKWVERKPPGLNVDRLHYVNAEGSLMFPDNDEFTAAIKLENLFVTDDGELAFKDPRYALAWAKVANLCSSEHWNDPVNRLIEMLILESMKRTIGKRYLAQMGYMDNGLVGTPEDYTYLIDRDFDDALEKEALSPRPDLFMNAIYSLIQSIAHRERQRFDKHKRSTYSRFIDDQGAREFPNQLVNPHRAAFGILPAQVEILSKGPSLNVNAEGIATPLLLAEGKTVGILKQLKFRQFDPLVLQGDKVLPLSTVDPNFMSLKVQHADALRHVGAVALHVNPDSQEVLILGAEANREFIVSSGNFVHLSPDQIRNIIKRSGSRALDLAMQNGIWVDL